MRDSEIAASRHQLAALTSERQRALAGTQVTAPMSGQVVYHHSAPGLVASDGPILAVSTGTGFDARVVIPAGEISALAQTDKIQFLVEKSLLNRSFEGKYQSYELLPSDPSKAIAHFEVQPSDDVVSELTTSSETALPVAMRWRPDMFSARPAQLGAVALAFGICGIFVSAARRKSKQISHEERLAATHSKVTLSKFPSSVERAALGPRRKTRISTAVRPTPAGPLVPEDHEVLRG